MKKLFLFIISFVVLFSFSSFLKAECKDEDLNEWATTIKGEYIVNEKSDSHALKDAFSSFVIDFSTICYGHQRC